MPSLGVSHGEVKASEIGCLHGDVRLSILVQGARCQ